MIRKATPDDAQAITRVRIETWRTAYAGIIPDSVLNEFNLENETRQRETWLAQPRPRVSNLCAELDGKGVVGFADTGPIRSKLNDIDGELYAIYVLKEHQGLGIGGALFEAARNSLIQNGFKQMIVWVLKDNPNVHFYRSMGGQFVTTKEIFLGKTLVEEGYLWHL